MKKAIVFLITFIIIAATSSFTCYATEYDDYIEETNNKFGLNLEKNINVENDTDFIKFKKDVDKMAVQHVQNCNQKKTC